MFRLCWRINMVIPIIHSQALESYISVLALYIVSPFILTLLYKLLHHFFAKKKSASLQVSQRSLKLQMRKAFLSYCLCILSSGHVFHKKWLVVLHNMTDIATFCFAMTVKFLQLTNKDYSTAAVTLTHITTTLSVQLQWSAPFPYFHASKQQLNLIFGQIPFIAVAEKLTLTSCSHCLNWQQWQVTDPRMAKKLWLHTHHLFKASSVPMCVCMLLDNGWD